jgi:peptidoglycan DL-endopeptidase CwlO
MSFKRSFHHVCLILILSGFGTLILEAQTTSSRTKPSPVKPSGTNVVVPPLPVEGRVATFEVKDLAEFDTLPARVQDLIRKSLDLTKQDLKYTYGSADPIRGGMDCSGTIYYLLKEMGIPDVPRQANEFYIWVRKAQNFHAVISTNPETFELNDLRPGDLLFWTGTYSINRDPPVTHVMLYLGVDERNGQRIMMGSSEGRYYGEKARYGVSVFDFKLPGFPVPERVRTSSSRFIGYGKIPGFLDMPAESPPGAASLPDQSDQ